MDYNYFDFADEIKISSVKRTEEKFEGIIKRSVVVKDNHKLRNRKGTYVSLEFNEDATDALLIEMISSTLRNMIRKKHLGRRPLVMCLGIGNDNFSSDSLGPKTASKLSPTSHLSKKKVRGLSVMVPGVMAQTGLDSARIAKAIIKEYGIHLVLVIDSLVTHDENRLFKVIQITDAGITPGSGIATIRNSVNEKFLGIPVIAIGVATAIPFNELINNFVEKYEELSEEHLNKDIVKKLYQNKMFYTPKDTEEVIDALSSLISLAIENCFSTK